MTRSFAIALLAGALTASCFSPNATECPEGFFCPEGKYCAANQLVCIDDNDDCGNGATDSGEVCDDGNIQDGDGCSAHCDSDETCGNNVVDDAVEEVCDDNNTEDGDDCSADCKSTEVCGNNIIDDAVGEKCDDGDQDGGDGCNSTCTSDETCGNDFTDVLVADPEFCDDGNNDDGDGCSADCKSGEGCGNGLIDEGEVCDGDNAGTGGETATCDDDCTPVTCGDGNVNLTATEDCDGTGEPGDPGTGGETSDCNVDCTTQMCGDGKLNTTALELCDQGPASTTGCDSDCTFPACDDGIFNDPAEICDDGTDTVACDVDCTQPACNDGHFNDPAEFCDTGTNTSGCDAADCSQPACGDNIINTAASEECDDNNMANNDNCVFTNGCKNNICGDGYRDQAIPVQEACDGNNDGTGGGTNVVGCDTDCTLPVCNDGIFNDPAEFCDTGVNTAGCDAADCSQPVCGDNILNTAASEECDDNNVTNTDNCVFALGCALAECGDGYKDTQAPGIEGCDGNDNGTGGGTDTATCDIDCTTPTCGDGHFNDPAEVCDDSNGSNLDNCLNNCAAASCGDGFVDGQAPTIETCDQGVAINGTSACAYGATSDASPTCTICNVGCTANAGPFSGPYCGDSTTSNGEICDDNNALACGTCNAACAAAVTPAAPIGSLKMIDGNPLARDNERFTINDGFGSLTFEYDGDNDCCTAPVISIDFDNSNPESTPAELAVLTRDAINAQHTLGTTAITAVVSGTDNTVVLLTNTLNGSGGNQAVTETVGDAGFVVTGMSGGAANDCDVGVQCKTDSDCDPNLICKGSPTKTCQLPTCGDGIETTAVGEECDDGNSSNNDSCPNTCKDAECGDGFEWNTDGGAEACDDGNSDNDDSCPDTCLDATCGDGFVWSTDGGTEACDDHNNLICGTCNAACTATVTPNNATGGYTATATANLDDGDTFTVSDGVNPTKTFEFDMDAVPTITPGNFRVDLTAATTAANVGLAMRTAIDLQTSGTFTIDASGSNATVTLTNTVNTGLGNGGLSSSDVDLTFTQMSGGLAVDCLTNNGCNGANICSPALTCDTVTDNRCE